MDSWFWEDQEIKAQPMGRRFLYSYLLTCPHRNCLGLYRLPAEYIAADLGITPETARKGLEGLTEAKLITYYPEGVVFIPNWFLIPSKKLQNKNQLTGATTILKSLNLNTSILMDFALVLKGLAIIGLHSQLGEKAYRLAGGEVDDQQLEGLVLVEEDKRDPVREIFDYWKSKFKKNANAKLTGERARLIKARLDQGYDLDFIKGAIDGCAASDWHSEQGHHDIELICRSGSKLEGFHSRREDSEETWREKMMKGDF